MPGDVVTRLRAAARSRRPAATRGLWVSFLSAYGLEVVLGQRPGEVDWLCLDLQHGDLDVSALSGLLRVTERADVTTFVRPPSHDPGTILRIIDAGADGLVVPTVESSAQARALVDAAMLPPVGRRSSGSARTGLSSVGRTIGRPDPLLLLMVETAAGLAAAGDIAATNGVDGIFVGPYDLTLSLGATSPGDDKVQAVISQVVETTRRHNKVVGMYAGRPDLLALAPQLDLIAVDNDVTALRTGLRQVFVAPPT